MNQRPDHLQAGRQLLELQLAMMRRAMTLMADSAQRFVELSLGAANLGPGGAALRQDRPAPAPAAASLQPRPGSAPAAARPASAARIADTRDYALRMQQDVDSILHAFAMVPDAADRLIRTSALLAEKPGRETAARERPAKPAPARRPGRRQGAEHAR